MSLPGALKNALGVRFEFLGDKLGNILVKSLGFKLSELPSLTFVFMRSCCSLSSVVQRCNEEPAVRIAPHEERVILDDHEPFRG